MASKYFPHIYGSYDSMTRKEIDILGGFSQKRSMYMRLPFVLTITIKPLEAWSKSYRGVDFKVKP